MLKLFVNRSFASSCRFIRQFSTQVASDNNADEEKRRKVLELEIELMRQVNKYLIY